MSTAKYEHELTQSARPRVSAPAQRPGLESEHSVWLLAGVVPSTFIFCVLTFMRLYPH